MDPLIEIRNLSFHFSNKIILEKINLSFFSGEIIALVGNSGSGKSTFGKLLIQLQKPDEGEILYKGINLKNLDLPTKKKFQKNCQLIFQHPSSSLNPKLTVFSILEEPLLISKVGAYLRKKKILEILKKIGLKKEHLFAFPRELSGGMQQRIAIARALLLEPEFLICDEITSSLDFLVQKEMIDLLKKLNSEKKITLLLITHDLKLAHTLANRILILKEKKISIEAPCVRSL